MQLRSVDKVESIDPEAFKKNYYEPKIPLVITGLSKDWAAYQKWDWDYFKSVLGDKKVGLYNNVKSDASTTINEADDYKTFGDYIDMIRQGPAGWRIFLFNIFSHAPQLTRDFTWPEHLMGGFVKKFPMLFTGGQTSITHMHFDIDLSHILHTQFIGKKKVLLFRYEEQYKLYRKPFEVLSLVDFSNYNMAPGQPDYEKFPALKHAEGYELILDHGDTLFMPAGFWHHMEYLESGFAMSLRAMQPSLGKKVRGAWNLIGMRNIDTLMKKIRPEWWYQFKIKRIEYMAGETLRKYS
ncbi:hypothetical protein BH20BAC1_BH20BAC1_13440 [soil metagenome]